MSDTITIPFSEIYEYALTNISSITLEKLRNKNPALFYRKMFLYLKNGVPYFNVPMGISEKLKYAKPKWQDKIIVADGINKTYDTGIFGMELAVSNVDGNVVKCGHDPETGKITFAETFAKETIIDVDTYTDGYFLSDLSLKEQQIIGMCIALAWFNQFSNSELDIKPKIKDNSFKMGSEANDTNARTDRFILLYDMLQLEMSAYSRERAYIAKVPASKRGV